MKPRRTPNDWRKAVLRDPGITDSTRVLLLVLAEHMRSNLHVSVPRRDLARWLNRSEKRIQERIKQAHEAGLLDTVSPGHRGHTAVYHGLFPDADSGTVSRALSEAEIRTPMRANSGTPGGPTTSKRPPNRYAFGDLPEEQRIYGEPGQFPGIDQADVDGLPNEANDENRWTA